MRDIKFRAWHTKQRKMYDADELGHDQMTLSVDGRGFINVSGDSLERSTFAGEKMIPLQFTGLKDRHDREIYEGDVLVDYKKTPFEAEWSDGGYWLKRLPKRNARTITRLCADSIENCELEIVGNIYDNPELLEAKCSTS